MTGSGKRSSAGSSRGCAGPFIARSRRSSKRRWALRRTSWRRSLAELGERQGTREKRASPASTTWPIISTRPASGAKPGSMHCSPASRRGARRPWKSPRTISRSPGAMRRARTSAVRYRISEGYGGALMLLGRYEDAAGELEGTIELAEDPERKARIEALQGEILFKQGSMDGSIALYENGLRRLGYWVPRNDARLRVWSPPRVGHPVRA